MKKSILLLALGLLTTTSFGQKLYSELSPWQNTVGCTGGIPHGICPTFDKLCNDMTTTCPPTNQWRRIGTPSRATDAAGNDVGVLIWASGGDSHVEGIFTDYNFVPGKKYSITVGIHSFNMPGSLTNTKLRLYAASGLDETPRIPCCDEPALEDNAYPAPNNVNQHWVNNVTVGGSNPQIEFIGDIAPSFAYYNNTRIYGAGFTPTMGNTQFVLHAFNADEGQLEAVIDYVIIEESCGETNFTYDGNTAVPYDINFEGDATSLATTWSFGDGNTSNNQVFASNSYPGVGVYNVCLTRDIHFGYCQYCREICINDPVITTVGCINPPHFSYKINDYNEILVTAIVAPSTLVKIDFGDGTIVTPTHHPFFPPSAVHQYTASGSYTVCVYEQSEPDCKVCQDICITAPERIQTAMATDDPGFGEGKPTSITSFGSATDKLQELTVVPNPASDVITLNFTVGANDKDMVDIEMYDVAGRKVLSRQTAVKTGANAVNIDISNLNSGIYIINVKNGTNTIKSKVVKQ